MLTLAENQRCPEQFESVIGQMDEFNEDFHKFETECEAKSELCEFLGVWLQLVAGIKNAETSEGEENWNIHVHVLVVTVDDSMPIFAECDHINYPCYESFKVNVKNRLIVAEIRSQLTQPQLSSLT